MSKSKPSSLRKQQRGAALVVGLILLLVLTVLAVSGVATAALELLMAGNEQYQERAFQAADAGIEQAMAKGVFTTDPAAAAAIYNDSAGTNPTPKRGLGTQIEGCPNQSDAANGQCEYFVRFDQQSGVTPVPGGGYSLGTGLQAYHFVVDAYGVDSRGATSEHQASFYVIGPGGT
jgi:type IV pilus assembly protein PilX